jgi:hypothetical protein
MKIFGHSWPVISVEQTTTWKDVHNLTRSV